MVRLMMKSFRLYFLAATCFALTSCVADRLAFWRDDALLKPYQVEGLEDSLETQTYISSIIQSRQGDLEISKDDDPAQMYSYHQENLRRDIAKAMRAKGFYDAQVSYVDADDHGTFMIDAGKRSVLSSLSISPDKYQNYMDGLVLKAGDPLDAVNILAAQKKIYNAIEKDSCSAGLKVSHKARLNTQTHQSAVIFIVEQGKPAIFGAVSFDGMEHVKTEFLHKVVKWKEGACFKRNEVDKAKEKLIGTGLFSRVDVILPENLNRGGNVPVSFVLKERAERTVKAGLSYYTDEGVRLSAGWEHRNFFGSGEKLNADLALSVQEQSIKGALSKPYFLRDDQSLNFRTMLERKDTDAFEEFGLSTGFNIKRQFNKRLSAGLGADVSLTRITDEGEEAQNFGLLSPIADILYDSRDNTLDPHKGWLLSSSVQPFMDILGETSPFFKTKASAQSYYALHDDVVLAGRFKFGSIFGTDTQDLPATERFFAGGGGSVRGFAYQEVGPFKDGDPEGGRSLAEGSLELRYKFTDTLGMVAFVDAGHVGDQIVPTFSDMAVGAGLGARYYTDFGPLRFDVGVPVSGDENTDQKFQVYISIGQAF